MADYSKFYVNGPYLHNLPGDSRVDMYERNTAKFNVTAKRNIETRGIAKLQDKYEQALAAEREFYAVFGVPNVQKWNEIFFGKNPNVENKVDSSDSLYSKTQKAINNREVYAILANIEKYDQNVFFKQTNDIFKEEVNKIIEKQGRGSGLMFTPANANSIDAFFKDMMRALGDGIRVSMTKNDGLIKFSPIMTQLKKSNFPQIGKDGVSNYVELTAAINKFMKTDLMKQLKSDALGRTDIQKSILATTVDTVRRLLASSLTSVDFGYDVIIVDREKKQEFLQVKAEYIDRIAKEFARLIQQHVAGKTLDGKLASGGLGELSLVIVIEDYINANQLNAVAKHVGTYMTKRRNKQKATIGQGPVDIQLRHNDRARTMLANIQVKNSLSDGAFGRARHGGKARAGDLNTPKVGSLQDLFDDITFRDIVDAKSMSVLNYHLTNSFFRNDDSAIQHVSQLLTLAIEHFVKSHTATALTEDIDQITRKGTGDAYLENHFMVRANVGLIPISGFILRAINILSASGSFSGLNDFTVKSDIYYSGAVDPQEMVKRKREALAPLDLGKGNLRYPGPLMEVGLEFGSTILKGVVGTSSLGKEVGLDISIAENMLMQAIGRLP